jgi:hypothetical protein
MALSHAQYDVLERAVAHRARVAVRRRGVEWVVVARRLHVEGGREALEAVHPSTGEPMRFRVEEIEHLEILA